MERKEAELRMLRKRLHDTRCRLGEVRDENARLRDELGLLRRENGILGHDPKTPAQAPAHGEAAADAAQKVYVDVRPALDAALASWDPMEDMRRLMLRSAVD